MRRRYLRGLWIIIVVGIAIWPSQALPARAYAQLANPRVEYVFGQHITFRADLDTNAAVTDSRFYFSRPEDTQANAVPATLDEQGVLVYEYDFMRYPLRAFSHLDYWFEVTLDGGEIVSSSKGELPYEDNRFVWQSASQSGIIRVHWYEGDQAFGQKLLEVAQKGLLRAQKWLPVTASEAIDIYAYASAQEMRSTMLLAGTSWVAGHADPDLRVIVVSLPPGPEQNTEMERQIPHEMMHILLYQLLNQTVGPAYYKLPTWLNEGLASINEILPNPYYHTILSQAAARNSLLSFSDICQNFPVDASGAYLAYAQAASFTRYLYDQYGAEGMETLVVIYAQSNEKDCQDGTTQSLGVALSQLERDWQQTIRGEKATTTEPGSPWPWVIVLGVVLAVPILVLLSSASHRSRQPQAAPKPRRST